MEEDQLLVQSNDGIGHVTRHKTPNFIDDVIRPCSAEFLAVMVFVFIGTTSVVQGDVIGVGIAHGLTIALLVAAFGNISGAHINPAVTLGVLLGGGINWVKAILYVIFQLSGAVVGAGITRGVLGYKANASDVKIVYEQILGGGHVLADGVSPAEGVLCEIALTTILVTAVLMTAVDTNGSNVLHPLAIGFAVCVDIIAAGKVTGASMNPARSFGPAVVLSPLNTILWTNHWIYWLGPALGAGFAALFYRLIFGRRESRLFIKYY